MSLGGCCDDSAGPDRRSYLYDHANSSDLGTSCRSGVHCCCCRGTVKSRHERCLSLQLRSPRLERRRFSAPHQSHLRLPTQDSPSGDRPKPITPRRSFAVRKILDSSFGESLGSQSSLFAIANLSGGVGYPKRRYKHPGGRGRPERTE